MFFCFSQRRKWSLMCVDIHVWWWWFSSAWPHVKLFWSIGLQRPWLVSLPSRRRALIHWFPNGWPWEKRTENDLFLNPALHLDLPSFIRFSLTAQAVHCSVQLLLRPCAHIGCAYILYMVRTCSEFRWWWSWFALNKGLFSCEKRQHDYRGWLLWLCLHPENHTGGSWCFLVNFQKRSGVKNCDLEKRHSRFLMNRWMMMI